MNFQKQFVSVSLELLQEFNLSFFEAGVLERIRYFSEYDESGSGWCYVGKMRLANEFNISKRGLDKAINRLIERNLLIKNDKGWLRVNLLIGNKVHPAQSSPGNKVPTKGEQSTPNINIDKDKDIHTINDNIVSIDSNSNSIGGTKFQKEQSSSAKKVRIKHWRKMNPDEFMEHQLKSGKFIVGEFNRVFLKQKEIDIIQNTHSKVVYNRAVELLGAYKANKEHNAYVDDYAVMIDWVIPKAKKDLTARGIDFNAILFKEREARKQAEQEAEERRIIELRKTNPKLFENE